MPRLLLNFGSPEQCELPLRPGTQSLGRDIVNDISIDHESISDAHCQIVVENDLVLVKDLGSATGTFIDAQPIQEGVLASGQTLRVGSVELVLDTDTPADLIEATTAPELQPATNDPPIPPPLPMPEPPQGAVVCKNHRKAAPRYECRQCGGLFCELCVTTRRVEGAQRKFCRECGGECDWLNAAVAFQPAEEKTFFELLPRAFRYPFQGDGWILMGTGTLFVMFMGFIFWQRRILLWPLWNGRGNHRRHFRIRLPVRVSDENHRGDGAGKRPDARLAGFHRHGRRGAAVLSCAGRAGGLLSAGFDCPDRVQRPGLGPRIVRDHLRLGRLLSADVFPCHLDV